MHWDKSPQEKLCYTLPTVKELLEQKRKREAEGPASSTEAFTALASSPPAASVSSTGVSDRYSHMAVRQQWAVESCSCYEPHQDVPGYEHAATPHTYEDSVKAAIQSPFWLSDPPHTTVPPLDPPHTTVPPLDPPHTTVPPLDAGGLQEALMFVEETDFTSQDEDGDTILHIYSAKGLRECAYVAAERLRDMGKLDVKEHKGKTALLVAVTANQPEIVYDLLLFGADGNACDVNGQTALHLAASNGFPAVLQVILSSGLPLDMEARNYEGMTPLHCAAVAHCASMKPASATRLGEPSLRTEAENRLTCLHMLLNAGASLFSQEIKSNKTVLHLAVKEGNVELVRYLLMIPLPNMQDFVNMKAHGHTALHMAAGLHGNPHQKEMLQLLLHEGADSSVRNLENEQPAHLLQSGAAGEQLKHILKRRSASTRRPKASSQDQV